MLHVKGGQIVGFAAPETSIFFEESLLQVELEMFRLVIIISLLQLTQRILVHLAVGVQARVGPGEWATRVQALRDATASAQASFTAAVQAGGGTVERSFWALRGVVSVCRARDRSVGCLLDGDRALRDPSNRRRA